MKWHSFIYSSVIIIKYIFKYLTEHFFASFTMNSKRIPSTSKNIILYIINIIHIILLLSLTLFTHHLILPTHISFDSSSSSIATPNDFKRISKQHVMVI